MCIHPGRVQTLHAVANKLRTQHVPVEWQRAIVHLGPIANEIDVDVMQLFSNSMVGLTPRVGCGAGMRTAFCCSLACY